MIVRKEGETLDVAENEVEKFEKLGWEKAPEKEQAQKEFVITETDVSKKK